MLNRFATLAAVCMLLPVAAAPLASADPPPPDPAVQPVVNAGPPPDTGAVPSAAPGVLATPDGWTVLVAGSNESLLPVAPLTTAISSREYLVGGTFAASTTGEGTTKLTGGSIEAGVQIGCGIISDETEINPGAGFTPGIAIPFTGNATLGANINLQGKVYLKPGTVTTVALDKKSFKGSSARVTITGVRVKFDQCAGQSFIRSYATVTASTDNTDDIITYVGVTKAV